jgi:GLPGLI family protein
MFKSIKFTILVLINLLLNSVVIGQRTLSEGTLQYDISIISAKNEAPLSNALNGANLTIYLKPSLSRTEMRSTLGTETTVYDNRAGNGFILKEYSGQKLMITMNAANWAEKNKLYENLNFTITEEETIINEYKCKKAIATLPDGKTFTVFYNPDIIITNKKFNNSFAQLPGLPVQYELQSGNLNFKYLLSKISYEVVGQSKFEAPRNGYRVMTYAENQQLKKGK